MTQAPVPAGLVEAFWEYERALMADDVPTLDRLFAPGPTTLRGDATALLVGLAACNTNVPARAPTTDVNPITGARGGTN